MKLIVEQIKEEGERISIPIREWRTIHGNSTFHAPAIKFFNSSPFGGISWDIKIYFTAYFLKRMINTLFEYEGINTSREVFVEDNFEVNSLSYTNIISEITQFIVKIKFVSHLVIIN